MNFIDALLNALGNLFRENFQFIFSLILGFFGYRLMRAQGRQKQEDVRTESQSILNKFAKEWGEERDEIKLRLENTEKGLVEQTAANKDLVLKNKEKDADLVQAQQQIRELTDNVTKLTEDVGRITLELEGKDKELHDALEREKAREDELAKTRQRVTTLEEQTHMRKEMFNEFVTPFLDSIRAAVIATISQAVITPPVVAPAAPTPTTADAPTKDAAA